MQAYYTKLLPEIGGAADKSKDILMEQAIPGELCYNDKTQIQCLQSGRCNNQAEVYLT